MIIENHPFDTLQVGDIAELARLVTEDDLFVFATASGNHNPMHLPTEDGDGDPTTAAVAPGMFVASLISAVLGMHLPGPGTLYRSQTLTFHDRASAGDELLTRVSVTALDPDGTVTLDTRVTRRSDGGLILEGVASVTLSVIAAQSPAGQRVWDRRLQ